MIIYINKLNKENFETLSSCLSIVALYIAQKYRYKRGVYSSKLLTYQ